MSLKNIYLVQPSFTNGSSGIFYNHCSSLTLHCLDGDVTRVALSKLKTVVF